MRIDGRDAYGAHRIVSGEGPHKLHKVEVQKYLAEKRAEKKACVFSINRTTWKGLK